MSAYLNDIQGVLPSWIENGNFYIKDYSGEVYMGTINARDYEIDSTPFKQDLICRQEGKEFTLVCRRDGTFTEYRNSDKILTDIGTYKLDEKILDKKFQHIGYIRKGKYLSYLMLDKSNNTFVYQYDSIFVEKKVFKIKKEGIVENNKLCHFLASSYSIDKFDETIFVCDGVNLLDWREYMDEVACISKTY